MGGALTTGGLVPQVWRLFKLRSAHEISLTFTLSFVFGIALWLSYGISLGSPPMMLWNSIALALGCAILYAKLRYGR
ncbi:MAG: hypothetical protein HY669_02480 [Chloroflexi bacterium]|nr:hypothetical protein [Chloroflexota bacterium]